MANDTKHRLMDAAEVLFAEHGLRNTSVRMIVSAIGANVASIRFHFGSLEELKKAVLMRRFEPLVARRLAGLEEARGASPRPVPVRRLLEIWFAPMLEMAASPDPGERALPRILARLQADPAPEYELLLQRELAPHVEAFLDELARALPHLERSEIAHRFDFLIGAFGHALRRVDAPRVRSSRRRRELVRRLTAELMEFAVAGLEAPAVRDPDAAPGGPVVQSTA